MQGGRCEYDNSTPVQNVHSNVLVIVNYSHCSDGSWADTPVLHMVYLSWQ